MAGGLVVLWLLIAVGLAAVGVLATPKGENQTLIRTSVMLVLACCYLMWAITYMAQLHPLIKPRRSDLRPVHDE